MRAHTQSATASRATEPERAIAELAKLQRHQIHLGVARKSVIGISRISALQDRVFAALNLKKPTAPRQLARL